MKKRPNKIIKCILVPFLLVFVTIFLTYIGMQTQLMDQELDRFISQNLVTQMLMVQNYFLTEEVKTPIHELQCPINLDALDNILEDKKLFPYFDYLAVFDLNGKLVNQRFLSMQSDTGNLREFEHLIAQKKITHEIFGIDNSSQGLVLKTVVPIFDFKKGIGYLGATRSLSNNFFEKIHQLTGLDILIFKNDQAILSTIPIKEGKSFLLPPKIKARLGEKDDKKSFSKSTERIFIFNTEYHAISFPFYNLKDEIVGSLMLVSSLEGKKQSLKKIVLQLLWATLIGGILLIFLGFIISKGITTPINQLIHATRRVSSGELNTKVDVQSLCELVTLSEDFNSMTENLKRTLISRNYFYEIINTINDLLIIISADHKIDFVNQSTLRVLGYSREELEGKSCDLIFEGDYPLRDINLEDIRQRGVVKDYSCTMMTKSGETIPVSFSWSIMWDERKQLPEILGIARDIREKTEAERKITEERDKLNTLINTTNDLIFIRDLQGKIIFVSHAVRNILGYSPDEFINIPLDKILSSNPLNRNFFDSPARWCNGEEKIEPYWCEFVASDGKFLFLEINESPLRGKKGGITQIMGIGRDISERRRLEEQLQDYQERRAKKLKETYRFGYIIGKSKKMNDIYELIKIVSQNSSTVLLKGESGTGKELIARAIHENSPRRDYPFVEVTCSVLSEHLLESELFGHVRGAFTGAIKDKQGRFEQAEEGTIFLDEIGDISLNQQIKLLRVLQEREIVRVGGDKRIKVDVRIIAATHKNLEEAITEGRFREDLYYRLNVVPVIVPPLRDRKEDIPLLVEHFIEKINNKIGKQITGISQKAMNILLESQWHGNVRQLENIIEYAMIRCSGKEIKAKDLSADIKNSQIEKASMRDLMANTEKAAIAEVLKNCQWDITEAAGKMNLSRTTLWRKMKKYEIKKVKI